MVKLIFETTGLMLNFWSYEILILNHLTAQQPGARDE
jgi:hypothetical protein